MINKFSNEDFLVATYRLASENNIMLKMVLGNQVEIMKQLQMSMPPHQEILAEVLPGYKPTVPCPELKAMIKDAGNYSAMYDVKMWEFAFDVKRIREDIEKDPDMGLKIE